MLYKGMSATIRLHDDSDDIPVILVGGLVCICPFMLFALLPAILIAQDRNGVYTAFCPKAISSTIPGVYFLVWGLPLALLSICASLGYYFSRRNKSTNIKKEKKEIRN